MRRIDRWLNWRPTDRKLGELPENGPTKLTKAGSVSFVGPTWSKTSNFAGISQGPELAACRDHFYRWWNSEQPHRRYGGNWISPLYIDFCEWLVGRSSVMCRRWLFERLLEELGIRITDGRISSLHLNIPRNRKPDLEGRVYKSPYNSPMEGR